MTWWDHETESLWVQLSGEAVDGPLRGSKLNLLPMRITPWKTWTAQHPDTLVLDAGGRFSFQPDGASYSGFVIGITLGDHAKAYPFDVASEKRVINDWIGDNPILVYADPDTRGIYSYLRKANDEILTFEMREGLLVDIETGSVWEPSRGFAKEGELEEQVLLEIPYLTAFPWSWLDFNPGSEIYGQG